MAPPGYFRLPGNPGWLLPAGYFLRKNHAFDKSAIPSRTDLRDAVREQGVPGGKIMKLRIAIIAALVGVEFSLMFSSRRMSRRPAPNAPPKLANTSESCFFSEDVD